ncbi:hypothetical protein [Nocardioides maradonensis]
MGRTIDTPTMYGGWEPASPTVDLSNGADAPDAYSGIDLSNPVTGDVIELSNEQASAVANYVMDLAARAEAIADEFHRRFDQLGGRL